MMVCIVGLVANSAFCAVKKPWTVLVYIAGDNDLYQFVDLNLKQMMKIGSNDTVNILVYLCKRSGGKKIAQKIIVNKNQLVTLAQDINIDSGIGKTVVDACSWAYAEYPADHVAFIGWDHGSGPLNRQPRGVCYDFSTGHYLTDVDLRNAFKLVTDTVLHKKIDIVGWDACLMASAELHATLEPYVDYVVSSQQTIPGPGWNYTRAFAPFSYSVTDPDYIARAWVAAYKQTYQTLTNDYTLSAVCLADFKKFVVNIDTISELLINLLASQNCLIVSAALTQAIAARSCVSFDDGNYIDMDNFYANLLTSLATMPIVGLEAQKIAASLKNALFEARLLLKNCVIANVVGKDAAGAAGISVYLPRNKRIHSSYYVLDWSIKHPGWLEFLRMFLLREHNCSH
jgi:hypothetical protein